VDAEPNDASVFDFGRTQPGRVFSCVGQDVQVRFSPDVKTGIESTMQFPAIQMAMDHHPFAGVGPNGKAGRVFIEIAPGVYHEPVIVTQNHPNITLWAWERARRRDDHQQPEREAGRPISAAYISRRDRPLGSDRCRGETAVRG
jgi:hypothetical protein